MSVLFTTYPINYIRSGDSRSLPGNLSKETTIALIYKVDICSFHG